MMFYVLVKLAAQCAGCQHQSVRLLTIELIPMKFAAYIPGTQRMNHGWFGGSLTFPLAL